MSTSKLQVALDFVDLDRAMKVAEAPVAGGRTVYGSQASAVLNDSQGVAAMQPERTQM